MLDVVNFNVRGGRGGDGHVSFRREKFVPRGGPDGGDGGRGGDVIFVATEGLSTLQQYSNTRFVNAEDGKAGNTKQRHGAGGARFLSGCARRGRRLTRRGCTRARARARSSRSRDPSRP